MKTWPCGHYHPCICALVAREGNDAVQIDMCEKRKNQHAVPEVTVLSERGLDGTTVDRDGSGKQFFVCSYVSKYLYVTCVKMLTDDKRLYILFRLIFPPGPAWQSVLMYSTITERRTE